MPRAQGGFGGPFGGRARGFGGFAGPTQRHPLIWPATVIYFAGHLLHVWGRHDPLTKLAKTFGR